jgi:hypothetical protein
MTRNEIAVKWTAMPWSEREMQNRSKSHERHLSIIIFWYLGSREQCGFNESIPKLLKIFWHRNLRPLSNLVPRMKGSLLVCRITHSEVTITNSEYAAPFWPLSLKSVHNNWLSGNGRSDHMPVLSHSRRCLSMIVSPYCGSQPGLLAVKFCLLARWLPKSRLGVSGKGTRKGEQASGRTFIWELNAYCRQRQAMILRIAQWHIIKRNKTTKIRFWTHPKLNMKWWIWFVH